MKNVIQGLVLMLFFNWELPQILVGFTVFAFLKVKHSVVNMEREEHCFFIETPDTGVSLGWFIFWTPGGNRFPDLVNDCRMHEYGHAKQSAMLGPLYLLIIGIPSISRVLYRKWYRRKTGKNWNNYYKGFPENWADKLGGVIEKA
jgi:hypothetical protein